MALPHTVDGPSQDRERFAVTFDYRCPFARNLHEHLIAGLQNGADWAVKFWPFSLNQVHVAPGEPDVWDDPNRGPDLLALQVGVAVRDSLPGDFLTVHGELFTARHDRGLDLRREDVIRQILRANRVDDDRVFAELAEGAPLETLRREHEHAVRAHAVFGVPTIVAGDRAVFVRVMNRPGPGGSDSVETVERLLDLVSGWAQLNEFKHTTIPR